MNVFRVESAAIEQNMPGSRQSKRFAPSALTEKIIPVLLVILVLALLSVIVIVALSFAGYFPFAS